jgi:hypothetical protein
MYANGKMMPVETGIILGMMSQNGGVGVNSSMIFLIYCKNFCKRHNASSPSTTIKMKKIKFPQSIDILLRLSPHNN